MFTDVAAFQRWFAERRDLGEYEVKPAPLDGLDGWRIAPGTGNVVHHSGRFFSVEGLQVSTDRREVTDWAQPIIVQPEIGILGIVTKKVDGVRYCLMQAKMEPGNVGMLQLSPTVQATRSNYTRVHRGNAVRYLDHFLAPGPGQVLFDSLQSEQGSWFLAKRNRNMIVEIDGDVDVADDFCWLSVAQLRELVLSDNVVNMDSRTVLSGLAATEVDGAAPAGPESPLHPVRRLLSWFTEMKASGRVERGRRALADVPGWKLSDGRISHRYGRYFDVIGVDVTAASREVRAWSQPMIAPRATGVVAFVGRHINDVFHVLVQARTEAGTLDIAEMAPTVQCVPSNYDQLPPDQQPRFLDLVRRARPGQIRLDVLHSEEGGRFYRAENRYLVIDAGEECPVETPPGFIWMTVAQLASFVQHGGYVNVEARTLVTCLSALPEPAVDRTSC